MKMSKGAEEAMNSITVAEAIALYVEGKCLICGNGQVTAIVSKDKAEIEEYRRVQNGY